MSHDVTYLNAELGSNQKIISLQIEIFGDRIFFQNKITTSIDVTLINFDFFLQKRKKKINQKWKVKEKRIN
jgi:hypothetical protein